jgi:hypothetical protein
MCDCFGRHRKSDATIEYECFAEKLVAFNEALRERRERIQARVDQHNLDGS